MSRQLAAIALVVCLMVPALAHSEDVTELIPGNAYGFVVFNRLADTDGKVQSLGQRMKLPIPSLLSMMKTQSRISGSVDGSGAMAFAFVPSTQGPTAVLYVPVDDYAAFVEQLMPDGTDNSITAGQLMGKPVIVGNKSGHAIVTWPSNRAMLQGMLSDKSAGQAAQGAVKKFVGDHDIAAVVTSSGMSVLSGMAQQGLEEVKAVMMDQVGPDNPALAGIEVYVQLLKAIDSEVASATIGLKLEEQGALRLSKRVSVQPTGKLAPIMRDLKPHDRDLLADLPNMPYVIAVGGVVPKGAFQPLMEFSASMMKATPQLYGLAPDQVDKMIELSAKYFTDVHSMSFLIGPGQENAPLYSEMLVAMRIPDAPAYLANYRKFWEELDDVIGDVEGAFFRDVELEDVKVDGLDVLKLTMPMTGLQGLDFPDQGELDALMEKMYGPDGITVYMMAADEDTVLMAYTDTALLAKGLQSVKNEKKSISQDRNVLSTSKQLASGAHAIGYWSPTGTIAFARRMIHLIAGPDADPQLPAFPQTPPAGWSMRATPEVVEFDAVLPAETIEAVGSFVEQMRQIDGAGDTN